MANSQEQGGSLCLETRIVEFQVEYSRSAKKINYLDALDSRGDLPKDMEPEEE